MIWKLKLAWLVWLENRAKARMRKNTNLRTVAEWGKANWRRYKFQYRPFYGNAWYD